MRAGLKQIVSERKQADLGASGIGRVGLSQPTLTSVQVAEDVAASPFGFKLDAITSTLTGSTVTGPAGAPPAMSVDLGAVNPNAGESVKFTFTLPDGSSETLTLTATASTTPAPGEFTIGATSDITATNLQTALTTALGVAADTELAAASALKASGDFFNIDAANPPQRVAGPPFNTATAMVNGTTANTVTWYTGEAGADLRALHRDGKGRPGYRRVLRPARERGRRPLANSANRRSGRHLDAGQPIRTRPPAARRSMTVSAPGSTCRPARNRSKRSRPRLPARRPPCEPPRRAMQQTNATLSDLLQSVEGVSNEEVAAQILAMQTSLQASLQTTAILYKTSILNYL